MITKPARVKGTNPDPIRTFKDVWKQIVGELTGLREKKKKI